MPEDTMEQDQSLEQNMIAALSEPRARFKGFVETSSDFAWETGPEGTLIFLSPTGALDFTPGHRIIRGHYRSPGQIGTAGAAGINRLSPPGQWRRLDTAPGWRTAQRG